VCFDRQDDLAKRQKAEQQRAELERAEENRPARADNTTRRVILP
jgi:hypothetical protein